MTTSDAPVTIADRYAAAVHAGKLVSHPETTRSPTDVLGAAGLAGKEVRTLPSGETMDGAPLALALYRRFVGGESQAADEAIVLVLARMVRDKADAMHIRMRGTQEEDMARAVLAWHRDGVCQPCGGTTYRVIRSNGGRGVVADTACPACRGTGKVEFAREFGMMHRGIAQWLLAEVEREVSKAGPAIMSALAPRLEL